MPSVETSSLNNFRRQADIQPRIRIFLTLTIEFVYGNTNGRFQKRLLACHTANTVAQEIIIPMKLRLNAPLQDVVYQFVVSLSTVYRIFSHWIVVIDTFLQ